ncbi:T9SS type A sorting domain-containing protein, partial [Lewinella sp. W8]|uniref:T9SS type A sorting domain-containing protein n=1 Tax=Lewinella sp. W8 TaxID=2528208 RepID=UPI0012B56733
VTFPEVYNVNNLQGNVTDADFVGVELGNVVRAGGRAALELNVEQAELAAGQTHTVKISNGNLAGFQGTLELAAGLELVNVAYEGEGAMNLNRAGEGMIAMAFNGPTQISLEVRATEDLRLSEVLRMTDAITYREGTAANGGAGSLSLQFGGALEVSAQNRLLQNTPNPVTETTVVRFELAQAGPATLTLRDAAGRIVLVRELDAVAGANQLELSRSDLGGSGVLTYTLTAGDFTASKKMVVVR